MAQLTVNSVVAAGLAASGTFDTPEIGGDTFVNRGDLRTFLAVDNQSASPVTLTVTTPTTLDGMAVADRAVVVPAGQMVFVGPFKASTYNQADEQVGFVLSAITDVTVAVFKVG